jgi:predicted deacylase
MVARGDLLGRLLDWRQPARLAPELRAQRGGVVYAAHVGGSVAAGESLVLVLEPVTDRATFIRMATAPASVRVSDLNRQP